MTHAWLLTPTSWLSLFVSLTSLWCTLNRHSATHFKKLGAQVGGHPSLVMPLSVRFQNSAGSLLRATGELLQCSRHRQLPATTNNSGTTTDRHTQDTSHVHVADISCHGGTPHVVSSLDACSRVPAMDQGCVQPCRESASCAMLSRRAPTSPVPESTQVGACSLGAVR